MARQGQGTMISSPSGVVPVGKNDWQRFGRSVSISVTELATDAELAEAEQVNRDADERVRFRKWPTMVFGCGPCVAAILILVLCGVWRSDENCEEVIGQTAAELHLTEMQEAARGENPAFQARIDQCLDYKEAQENCFWLFIIGMACCCTIPAWQGGAFDPQE